MIHVVPCRKLKSRASSDLKYLNNLIPVRFTYFLRKLKFTRRFPKIIQFLGLLFILTAINIFVFSYSYRNPTTRSDVVEQQKSVRAPVGVSTPPVLFNNYPHLTEAAKLTLDQCKKKPFWLPWERGVVTRMSPSIRANCERLWKGDEKEAESVQQQLYGWQNGISDRYYLKHYLTNCSVIKSEFNNFYVSQEEIEFPIAYLLNIHASLQQIVRFLKVIYRPHNVYCIHMDTKSPDTLQQSMRILAKCLPNVHLAKKQYNVLHETIDQVDALRSCYTDLLNIMDSVGWKYAINLCGRELPLNTNREIVRKLRNMKGANVVNPGVHLQDPRISYDFRRRILYRVKRTPVVLFSSEPLDPVPHNMPVYKNNTFVALTPDFVRFLFDNNKAFDFYLFLRNTRYPDEQYFVSLNRLPEAPGGHALLVKNKLLSTLPQVSMSYWIMYYHFLPQTFAEVLYRDFRCNSGYFVHNVCIVGVGDLQSIAADRLSSNVMFFNKYYEEYDHVVMDCAEAELLKRNRKEFESDCNQDTALVY